MKSATLLIVALANQGYWFGNAPQTIALTWAVPHPPREAVFHWQLMLGDVRIDGGQIVVPTAQTTTRLEITPPQVQSRVAMRLTYQLYAREDGSLLDAGEKPVHLFPDNLLHEAVPRLEKRTLRVWDSRGELSAALKKAEIKHEVITGPAGLQFARADLILVGPDELSDTPLGSALLLGQARSGASVLILNQERPSTLCGYRLAPRAVAPKMTWKMDHPLLRDFLPEDPATWWPAGASDPRAVQLPADEPALELGFWPRETEGDKPAPLDAVLLTKTFGKGRVVLCQIPLGSWKTDPRSQLFLANGLSYLTTRPEPILPPSQRRHPDATEETRPDREPEPSRTIRIPSGVKP